MGFEADLDAVANGQVEQPHHVEALTVQRVVDTEDVAHASDLEPDGVLIDIAAVGVVRDAVGDDAHRRPGAEVGGLKGGLRPYPFVLDHHQSAGVVGVSMIRSNPGV